MAINLKKYNEIKSIDIIKSVMESEKLYSTKDIIEILRNKNVDSKIIEECMISLAYIMDMTSSEDNSIIYENGKFKLNIIDKNIEPKIEEKINKNIQEIPQNINSNKNQLQNVVALNIKSSNSNISVNNNIQIDKINEERTDYVELLESRDSLLKLKKHYALNDCVQSLISYKEGLTILDSNKILYHGRENSNILIDEYLNDSRKNHLPYNNIPMFIDKKRGCKINYINQIFDYNKPYVVIKDGFLFEVFVLDSNISIIKSLEPKTSKEEIVDITSLSNSLKRQTNNGQTFFLGLGGEFIDVNKLDYIYKPQNQAFKMICSKISYNNINPSKHYYYINGVIYENAEELPYDYFKKYITSLKYPSDLLNFSFSVQTFFYIMSFVYDGILDKFLKITIDGQNINIELIKIKISSDNSFKIITCNVPVDSYTLEQVKLLGLKSYKDKEPKIKLKYNPTITKQDIKAAKQLIKKLNKNKLYLK